MSVRIFISAVSDEFRDYRNQLRSNLTRHNVEVKIQEDFKDYGGVTLDKLDLYIRSCDAVVHLVGEMTGSDAKAASTKPILAKYPDFADKLPPLRAPLDNGLDIPYTQWEAWLALYHERTLLIAKAQDNAIRGPSYAPTDASRAAQRMHLDRLRNVDRFPGFTFTNPDNLANQIAYTTVLDLLAGVQAERIARRADTLHDVYAEEEVWRLSRVFVSPNSYREAMGILLETRLVIIRGPGSVGKTTTAINLLAKLRRTHLSTTQPILMPRTVHQNLRDVEKLENALILLDAPFGARDTYEPAEPNIAAHFSRVLEASRRNWIVVTTRPHPLEEAKRIIERRDLDRHIIDLLPDAYGDVRLRRIFFKHILFHRRNNDLTLETVNYIRDPDKVSWIVRNLQFPHNIARFVQDELPGIKNQESIKIGLDRSKDTKEATRIYFRQRNFEEISFMLCVAFFGHYLEENEFIPVLRRFLSICEIPSTDVHISVLRRSVRYITQWGRVAFEHQDYLDGILEAVRKDRALDPYVKRFAPLLEELSEYSGGSVLASLGFPLKELARVAPQMASPITLTLLVKENPYAMRAAYLPLRALVKNEFEAVRPFLENAVIVEPEQRREPNYGSILFRKALRRYVLVPCIARGDVEEIVELAATFNKDLKVQIFIVQGLYDIYRSDQETAITFFREWWLYDPRRSLRTLQDAAMYRSSTNSRAQFVAQLLAGITPESAVNAIVDWSRTESRREDVRARLGIVLGNCLKYLARAGHSAPIEEIIREWTARGNDIQRDAALRFGR